MTDDPGIVFTPGLRLSDGARVRDDYGRAYVYDAKTYRARAVDNGEQFAVFSQRPIFPGTVGSRRLNRRRNGRL